MDLYRELILDHYRHPRGAGRLTDPDFAAVGVNPLCGDEVELTLRLDEQGRLEVGFAGRGCAISQAAASLLVEALAGKTVAAAQALERDDLLELLGIELSPVRLKCALLPLETLRLALAVDDDREAEADQQRRRQEEG